MHTRLRPLAQLIRPGGRCEALHSELLYGERILLDPTVKLVGLRQKLTCLAEKDNIPGPIRPRLHTDAVSLIKTIKIESGACEWPKFCLISRACTSSPTSLKLQPAYRVNRDDQLDAGAVAESVRC